MNKQEQCTWSVEIRKRVIAKAMHEEARQEVQKNEGTRMGKKDETHLSYGKNKDNV